MCSIAAAGLTATIASAVMGAGGQIIQANQTAKAQKASAEYNAQVAANEAATQQQLAQNEMAKGIADRERQQRQAARAMGEMRAGMGASGLAMDSGTNLALLEESATEHQYDSNIIMQNAAQAAWQHQVGATAANNQGAFAQYQKDNANSGLFGSYLGAGGTLIGGIGQGLGQYKPPPTKPTSILEQKRAGISGW